jgi:bifunctional DNA-binding transcriptional regulator/antitoxin component of YhaV-PrlF toxin-antitoxin module
VTEILCSTKGQVVIPKAMREAHGFAPGVLIEAVNLPQGVLLKGVFSHKKRPVTELFGMVKDYYAGPAISVGKMNEAVAEAAVEKYLRSKP